MMASTGNRVMDQSKQTAAAAILTSNINQQAGDSNNNPRAVQRCPRCDSSNTKFCYYNNYSLSQPRHFCKACKRYWTRGGTLRNVPVGGGCRKNKRIKKPNSSSISATTQSHHNNRDQIIGISKAAATSTSHHGTSLFYSNLPSNQLSDINNLTIPRSPPSFVFSRETNNGYDNILQPQFGGLGLNFSSTYLSSSGANINGYKNVFNPISTSSNSLLSNFSLFGTTSTTSPTTLVTSGLENQKLSWGGVKESTSIPTGNTHYQDLPFEVGENDSRTVSVKVAESVKIEDGNNKNKLGWNSPFDQNSSLMNDQQNNMNGSSDNNSTIFWNSLSVGGGGGTTNWSDDLYGSTVSLDPLI
ncbi:hypothetical protein C5167_009027 [Papaver somniferum]|uniref:Dof zinc finger protein n=1 Tax=Papaver somniferum TaxID=3469 RepID=A0A4Y7JXB5_PAPSO|nr:dof zinc finger protein DOF1.4-like [Papaver somniferum]RZC65337.1 hypothetical protein C5167_009027 [Papaver somniferum]